MPRTRFRFAALIAAVMACAAFTVAWTYDLPLRDPDGVAGPTYLRLPVLLALAFLTDVVPRALWRAGSLRELPGVLRAVVAERWPREQVSFAVLGLGTWYVTYVAFRNLKSFVPFVNGELWDDELARLDSLLFLGNDPAAVLHAWLGTGVAAHVLSAVYIAWIAFVPLTLVVALMWSRNSSGGELYVTAVALDWVFGVATYFALPTLGPVYSDPTVFSGLSHTAVTDLQTSMIADRAAVLDDPFGTTAVQTIAAFGSLHVGIMVTACLVAHMLGLSRACRYALAAFLAATVLSTVYLGWHFAVDALGGAVIGAAAVVVAAMATGNVAALRRLREPVAAGQPPALSASRRR
jgi:hypothetical protein